MPVYNSELYIQEAINSILNQTFTDFEFLIYNDGSTDKTHDIITSYKDDRIIYKKIQKNGGHTTLLNSGLIEAKGKYIARMDADDISMPERLEQQFKFMEEHPAVGICGSWVEFFGSQSGSGKTPVSYFDVTFRMFFGSPMSHPTVMMRNDFLKRYHLKYDPKYHYCEDYKLFAECFLEFEIVNLPIILLKYRMHDTQISSKKWREQFALKNKIQANICIKALTSPNNDDIRWFLAFCSENTIPDDTWLKEVELYRKRIIDENMMNKIFPHDILRMATTQLFQIKTQTTFYNYYFRKYYNQKRFTPKKLFQFLKEKYQPHKHLGRKLTLFFVVKCLIFYKKKSIVDA